MVGRGDSDRPRMLEIILSRMELMIVAATAAAATPAAIKDDDGFDF